MGRLRFRHARWGAAAWSRCWWTDRMAADPSPTAAATRLVDPERRSPTASSPGRLVSSGSGLRSSASQLSSRSAGNEVAVGSHEAVLVGGDVAEPRAVRFGADEGEQGRAVQGHGRVALRERGLLEHRAAGEGGDRGALVDLDPRVGVDPVDEVRAHGRGQRSSDGDAHRGGVLGEEHGGLSGGVATTDDEHRDPGASPSFELRGGVVDARHLVPVEIGDGELAVVSAGRSDDGAPGHLAAVGEGERVVPGHEVEPGDGARAGDDRTELLGLERGPGGEVLTGDAGGEAEVVLDARARGCLSADRRCCPG